MSRVAGQFLAWQNELLFAEGVARLYMPGESAVPFQVIFLCLLQTTDSCNKSVSFVPYLTIFKMSLPSDHQTALS